MRGGEHVKLRFGQPKDPAVISEQLIESALKDGEDRGKPFNEVKTLSLSYSSNWLFWYLLQTFVLTSDILKIQNLDGFDRLEKLQLDNNTIEKIENLEHLSQLKW